MSKTSQDKRNKILDVAKRRFAHYGLAKTTMAEIAKDLAFSKALLYYYFPDKNSLYTAVIEHVATELGDEIEIELAKITNVEDAVVTLLEKRVEFLKKYFYIFEYTFFMTNELKPEINEFIVAATERQRMIIQNIFQKGKDTGELGDINVEESSELYLFASMGMRMAVLKDVKSYFAPDKEEFDIVLDLQKKMSKIFIKGLKAS